MTAKFMLFGLLLLAGCKTEAPVPLGDDSSLRQIQTQQEMEEWYTSYAMNTNASTMRVYQCEAEMYSMAYKPVESGPICRSACPLVDQVNAMVDSAPASIADKGKYRLRKPEWCSAKPPHRKKGK